MVDHYRPIHFLYWQKIGNLCLKVKKTKQNKTKQKNNKTKQNKQNKTKQTKTKQKTTELSFLGTETQFSLEILLQAYSWQR